MRVGLFNPTTIMGGVSATTHAAYKTLAAIAVERANGFFGKRWVWDPAMPTDAKDVVKILLRADAPGGQKFRANYSDDKHSAAGNIFEIRAHTGNKQATTEDDIMLLEFALGCSQVFFYIDAVQGGLHDR
jgi:hypothetical protein